MALTSVQGITSIRTIAICYAPRYLASETT